MVRNRTAWLLALIAAILCVGPATAQELTSGTLAGKVVDPAGKPVVGASVLATCEQGTRTAETDESGQFLIPFLRPSNYTVRIEASGGYNSLVQNDVVVSLNQRTQLSFTLQTGMTETVVVTAQAPLVDPKSTSTGTTIKYDQFSRSLPLGRAFTDTYLVAPGVVSGLGTGAGNVAIGGASGLENMYLIDGVNITNTGYGGIGAYNLVYGSLGTGVTSEFLDEVQIKTGGFEAEYGQALGGIINTIVKSGTNDFKGSVAMYTSPAAVRSESNLVNLATGNANVTDETTNDLAFSVGGPIRKDKLFYFFAFNPVVRNQTVRANNLANPAYDAAAAGVPAFDESGPNGFGVTSPMAFPSANDDLTRTRHSNNYAAKFSWVVNPSHQVELTMFGDPSVGPMGPQRDTAPLYLDQAAGGGDSEIHYGSNNAALKWNAVFTPRFFMEAQVGWHDGRFRETSDRNELRYTDIRNVQEYVRGATSYDAGGGPVPLTMSPVATRTGGIGFIANQDDQSLQFQVKMTSVVGRHEIRYGMQRDSMSYREASTFTGPSINIGLPESNSNGDPVDANLDGNQDFIFVPTYGGALVDVRNSVGGDPTIAYDSPNRFRVSRARIGPTPPATQSDETSLFVQDSWSVSPRVTVKAGLRYTTESLQGAGDVTLPFGTQTINVGGVESRIYTQGTSTYSPNDYTFSGNWAPRLGVVWDALGNGKSRAWVNVARYFERVPNDLAVRAFSTEVGVSVQDFDDRALTTPRMLPFTVPCDNGAGGSTACAPSAAVFTQGMEPTSVVSGTQLPYEDEISGGFGFEVAPQASVEVRAIYRQQGRVLEDVQVNAVEQINNFYYGVSYGYPYDPFGGTPSNPVSTRFPAATFGAYELANPGTKHVPAGGLYPFPDAKRDYKAIEAIFTKRMSKRWSMFANYRLSRLTGNYEGLFRNDNGQSDPNITSLYDFPDSPLMHGQFTSGPLPTDVTHVLHVYPSYRVGEKLTLGANLSWQSGVPRTSLLAHPIYTNGGEIPGIDPVYGYWADNGLGGLELRSSANLSTALNDPDAINPGVVFLRSYTPVQRGNLGRTPDIFTLDLHADYPVGVGKSQMRFFLDVFNVLDQKPVTQYVDTVEMVSGVTDPNYGRPNAYVAPRTMRLGLRWDF
jgi:carboxypeptidase family protein